MAEIAKVISVADLQEVMVISPHLDDAVFSCADLIGSAQTATVVTLFAGNADDGKRLTPWDKACGFANAAQAMAVRKQEDREALDMLGATPVWLDFRDDQYGEDAPLELLTQALLEIIEQQAPATVVLPLGLYHRDHLTCHAAAMAARKHKPELTWVLYEDSLYRDQAGALQNRLSDLLFRDVLTVSTLPLMLDVQRSLKTQAVKAYASQLHALGEGTLEAILLPERYWRPGSLDPEGSPC